MRDQVGKTLRNRFKQTLRIGCWQIDPINIYLALLLMAADELQDVAVEGLGLLPIDRVGGLG